MKQITKLSRNIAFQSESIISRPSQKNEKDIISIGITELYQLDRHQKIKGTAQLGFYAALNGVTLHPVWYGPLKIQQKSKSHLDFTTLPEGFDYYLNVGFADITIPLNEKEATELTKALENYIPNPDQAQAESLSVPLIHISDPTVTIKKYVHGGGKNWIAEITGHNATYHFERDFLHYRDITQNRSNVYREFEWTLNNGVYEYHFAVSSTQIERGFWLVNEGQVSEIDKLAVPVTRELLRSNEAYAAYQRGIDDANPCHVTQEGDTTPDSIETRQVISEGKAVSGTLCVWTEDGSIFQTPIVYIIEKQEVKISTAYMTGLRKNGEVFGALSYYDPQSLERLIRKHIIDVKQTGTAFAYTLSVYSHDKNLNYSVPEKEFEQIRFIYGKIKGKKAKNTSTS